jgi:hypothetical protein
MLPLFVCVRMTTRQGNRVARRHRGPRLRRAEPAPNLDQFRVFLSHEPRVSYERQVVGCGLEAQTSGSRHKITVEVQGWASW